MWCGNPHHTKRTIIPSSSAGGAAMPSDDPYAEEEVEVGGLTFLEGPAFTGDMRLRNLIGVFCRLGFKYALQLMHVPEPFATLFQVEGSRLSKAIEQAWSETYLRDRADEPVVSEAQVRDNQLEVIVRARSAALIQQMWDDEQTELDRIAHEERERHEKTVH